MSQVWKIPDRDRQIIDAFKKAGPRSASSRRSIEDVVSSLPASAWTPREIAHALLYILFAQPSQHHNLLEFVSVVKAINRTHETHWIFVVQCLDIPDLRVHVDDFTRLFRALRQVAIDSDDFDLQYLWRGTWQFPRTQLSFLCAYLEMHSISPTQIPGFQPAFDPSTFTQATTQIRKCVDQVLETHHCNLYAMQAVYDVILGSDDLPDEEDAVRLLEDIFKHHRLAFVLFLSNTTGASTNYTPNQERFIHDAFCGYLNDQSEDSEIALRVLFHYNRQAVVDLCMLAFHADPRKTETIARRAQQLGWTDFILDSINDPLALDIACLLQKDNELNLEQWISQAVELLPRQKRLDVGNTLWKFLRIKADDEYRFQKGQPSYQSVPLNLHTAFVLLWKVSDLLEDREQLKAVQYTCLTTYPRLMNYGAERDAVLAQASEQRGHKIATETDNTMSDMFGQMYRGELTIRDMVSEMRGFKTSNNESQQDLFCCIVHGLFDEYGCYGEYPETALEKTALLFGSIINFKLLPPIPREYGLTLIVDAVRDNETDTPMHRFGIEALLQLGDQLSDLSEICTLLLQTPTLQHPEIIQRARDGVSDTSIRGGSLDRNGHDDYGMLNGIEDEVKMNGGSRGFRGLRADPPETDAHFVDPDQKSQEKILFVINNLSKENMDAKLEEMRDFLKPEHFQWFASYLVEQRARLEPNNQELYNSFLSRLDDPTLSAEVLRETYTSIVKTMSARSTMDTATERGHLKNLGGWLGSLTLAQDRPIKHRNIYFMDLLRDGFETQRLIIVIPFTCKVLIQGKDSIVFKPPNPWLMEILGVLVELYLYADLKLNLKFEIEVLCKDLGLDHKKLEPANEIREYQLKQQNLEEQTNDSAMDNIDDLDTMLRGGRLRETFTVADIMQALPSLDSVLRYPPPSGGQQEQNAVKQIINKAVQRAIEEIIAPVVERSITIASLSTSQLVSKDYAIEPSPDKYTDAAREMVKSLAGNLALVTCKEPLRMSIQNYIRQYMEESGAAFMAEGQILMTVNDNLDVAAQLIKEAAEHRAVPEMDQVVEEELVDRRRFLAENPNDDIYGQPMNRWSTWIPEPYKMIPGGLNDAQRAVYEEFERRVHGSSAGHIQNASTDSTGRQLPDILNESLAMPNLSTPAGQPALPHHSPMTHESGANSVPPQQRVNGIQDSLPPHERMAVLVDEVQKATRTSSVTSLRDLEKDSMIVQNLRHFLQLINAASHPAIDHIARQLAEKITSSLLRQPPQNALEAEFLAFMLNKLCTTSEAIVREVMRWITANEDSLLQNSYVAAAFIGHQLMEFSRVDGVIASAMRDHSEVGLRLLQDLMDQTLFNEEPSALRADFVNSILALYAWLRDEPDHPVALEISSKLKAHGVPEYATVALSDKTKAKQDQMLYIFDEWASLNEHSPYSGATYASFLRDLHGSQLITSAEDLVTFLRLAIEKSIEIFEIEAQSFRGSFAAAFSRIDALALLVVLLVKFQGEQNGAVKLDKVAYFDSMLSLIVLIINSHQELRGVNFNQRVFTRLFGSMLHCYAEFRFDQMAEHADFMLSFAKTFESLQPVMMPFFAFGWTTLVAHRVFVEGMLRHGHEDCILQYRELLGLMLQYPTAAMEIPTLQQDAEALMRGVWRNIFVLQNDYPDFVCANHAYLCARTSLREPVLRNLILAAQPFGMVEPDPLTPNLKVERIEDMKRAPSLIYDVSHPLENKGLLSSLQQALHKSSELDVFVKQITDFLKNDEKNQPSFRNPAQDCEILESLVLVMIQDVLSTTNKFNPESTIVTLVSKLLATLQPRQKYLLITSIFDQLRYPNTHTEYCCKLILHIWATNASADEAQTYARELIVRVLRERIDQLRPNPWGAIVVFKELSDNSSYGFWDTQPFVNEPELRQRLVVAARSTGVH